MDILETIGEATLNVADALGNLAYTPFIALTLSSQIASASSCMPLGDEIWCKPVQPYLQGAIEAKQRNPETVATYTALNQAVQLPPDTLTTMLAVESRMGELNVNNGQGYAGIFQGGVAEHKRFGIKGVSRLNKVNSTVMAINYAHHNIKQLPWKADYRDVYYAHQQGVTGYQRALKLKQGKPITKQRTTVRNLVNNLPTSARKQVANKIGKRYVLKPNVTPQQVAVLYFKIWDSELAAIKNG